MTPGAGTGTGQAGTQRHQTQRGQHTNREKNDRLDEGRWPMRPSTLHIPTDPNRGIIYRVTGKGTGNGWQGTGLLWAWSVHRSDAHTKWATARAPLPDSHGLGEIRSPVCHVIHGRLGAGRGLPPRLPLPAGKGRPCPPGPAPGPLPGHPAHSRGETGGQPSPLVRYKVGAYARYAHGGGRLRYICTCGYVGGEGPTDR